MTKFTRVLGRAFLLIYCLFLATVSMFAGWKVAAVIGILLLSANYPSVYTFKKNFRVHQWIVTLAGSALWLLAAALEASPK